MSTWAHLTEILSASPATREALRVISLGVLLAGFGIFVRGLAAFLEVFRPPRP